jgi:hypothetical protein
MERVTLASDLITVTRAGADGVNLCCIRTFALEDKIAVLDSSISVNRFERLNAWLNLPVLSLKYEDIVLETPLLTALAVWSVSFGLNWKNVSTSTNVVIGSTNLRLNETIDN